MLHDRVLTRTTMPATACLDRRRGDRVPFPAELVLVWHHDLDSPVRYRILDASDGGFRIRTSLPMVEGMTGMALALLPEGTPINRPVMIAWTTLTRDGAEHEAGLRYF
jgi:hypothetical protein